MPPTAQIVTDLGGTFLFLCVIALSGLGGQFAMFARGRRSDLWLYIAGPGIGYAIGAGINYAHSDRVEARGHHALSRSGGTLTRPQVRVSWPIREF